MLLYRIIKDLRDVVLTLERRREFLKIKKGDLGEEGLEER